MTPGPWVHDGRPWPTNSAHRIDAGHAFSLFQPARDARVPRGSENPASTSGPPGRRRRVAPSPGTRKRRTAFQTGQSASTLARAIRRNHPRPTELPICVRTGRCRACTGKRSRPVLPEAAGPRADLRRMHPPAAPWPNPHAFSLSLPEGVPPQFPRLEGPYVCECRFGSSNMKQARKGGWSPGIAAGKLLQKMKKGKQPKRAPPNEMVIALFVVEAFLSPPTAAMELVAPSFRRTSQALQPIHSTDNLVRRQRGRRAENPSTHFTPIVWPRKHSSSEWLCPNLTVCFCTGMYHSPGRATTSRSHFRPEATSSPGAAFPTAPSTVCVSAGPPRFKVNPDTTY